MTTVVDSPYLCDPFIGYSNVRIIPGIAGAVYDFGVPYDEVERVMSHPNFRPYFLRSGDPLLLLICFFFYLS
jgi:hypothetical protein